MVIRPGVRRCRRRSSKSPHRGNVPERPGPSGKGRRWRRAGLSCGCVAGLG